MEKKYRVTVLFFFLVFFTILSRLFFLQVINHNDLLKYSNNQFIRTEKVYPNRGNIYDRNLDPLAINVSSYSIFAIPKSIKSYKQLRFLRPLLKNKYGQIIRKLQKRKRFTWIVRNIKIDKKILEKIESTEGIYYERNSSRFYPNHELAAQTLGFVGVDNTGLAGLEFEFDKSLKGTQQVVKYHIDAKGRPIKHESNEFKKSSKSIILSIDKDIQGIVEKSLKEAVIKHKALKGGAGVIDTYTGEILAMANYPSFDPNDLSSSKPNQRKLAFVSDPFEPGSVFKAFTIISALEHGIINTKTNYYCEKGEFRVGKHIIKESSKEHQYEWLDINDIMKYSSNIGTTKIAFDLGYKKLKSSLLKFGFGEKTNLELASESRGIFYHEDKIKDIHLSNISFGQGIATTGIQVLAAYNAIANNGFYIQPTLIKDGNSGRKPKKLVSNKSISQVVEMLISVVEDGTGQNAKIRGFNIAGKTGTAQKPSSNGGYKGYIPSFVGFPVGVKKPFVVFVYIDDPEEDGYYGNQVAAPVFKKITESILIKNNEHKEVQPQSIASKQIVQKLKITKSSVKRINKTQVPNFYGLDKKSAKKMGEQYNLYLDIQGRGVVTKQFPEDGTKIPKTRKINLVFDTPKYE